MITLISSTNIELLKILAPLIAAILTVGLALFTFYKKGKLENEQKLDEQRLRGILKAHERCWSLIAYLTPTENGKSIIIWVKLQQNKKYYFLKNNYDLFIEELRVIMYDEGNGIYFSSESAKALYEIRSILFGLNLKLKSSNTTDVKMEIEKEELVATVWQLTEELRKNLRKDIKSERRK